MAEPLTIALHGLHRLQLKAGEFEEAIDLICSRKVDVRRILTKVVTVDEAPDIICDIEKNPGKYLKVSVLF